MEFFLVHLRLESVPLGLVGLHSVLGADVDRTSRIRMAMVQPK